MEAAKAVVPAGCEVTADTTIRLGGLRAKIGGGRVLCALGYSGAALDVSQVDVSFASAKGCIAVCQQGAGVDFSEEKAKEILLEDEIQVCITLHEGCGQATAWGCDLTYDYVKINGDYRT